MAKKIKLSGHAKVPPHTGVSKGVSSKASAMPKAMTIKGKGKGC